MIQIIFKDKNNQYHRLKGPAYIDNIGRFDYWLNDCWQSYRSFLPRHK